MVAGAMVLEGAADVAAAGVKPKIFFFLFFRSLLDD
jgi:hypothetical protein